MTPVLYSETETLFESNGIGLLSDALTCEVSEIRNGAFTLEMEYPASGKYASRLQDWMYIKAKPNDYDAPHIFMIYEVSKKTSTFSLLIRATTKTDEIGNTLISKFISDNVNASSAMSAIKSNAVDQLPYDFVTNISNGDKKISWERRNPLSALVGEEGSMVDIFGGELKRENDRIYLYATRGTDRGVRLTPRKGLKGLTYTVNIKNVVTRILPYVTVTLEGQSDPITITGSVVSSPLIKNYPHRPLVSVDFSTIDDEIDTLEKLNKKASTYFTSLYPDADKPDITLTADLLSLQDSSEYERFKKLEKVSLCDTVEIYVPKYGVHEKIKVTKIVYDSLRERNLEIECGDRPTSILDTMRKEYSASNKDVITQIEVVQWAANQKNKVFRTPIKPTIGMHKDDLWYQPVGQGETILYVYDGNDWVKNKVSAGLIQGTLDATNGDVNLINVNVDSLVGRISNFVQSNWNGINSNVSIDGNALKVTHSDGSYTMMNSQGFSRYTAGSGKTYHYLVHVVTFVLRGSSVKWIQLPNEFKGKPFTAYCAIADSLQSDNIGQSINRIVCTGHPDYSTDFVNARVPLIGYTIYTNGTSLKTSAVQGMLIAIL